MPLNDVVGGFGSSETNGNIGNSFLRHFILYMNYDKQQVILEKGDDFEKEFPIGRSGLQIMFDEDKNYEVVFVPSNTPASKAGFMAGDIILAINEIDVENIDGLESMSRIMRGEIGTKLKFKISRGEIEKEMKLKLQEIY